MNKTLIKSGINIMHFHTEIKDGFTIDVYALPEDISPKGCFDTEDSQEIIDKIESGDLEWFCAKVTASKNGIILADDYLGACCYESLTDFINPDCYFGDMRESVIKQAKEAIKLLSE